MTTHRADDLLRFDRSSDYESHGPEIDPDSKWLVRMQEVHLRFCSNIRAVVLNIGNHSDHGKPRNIRTKPDSFSDGIYARPDVSS